MESWGGGTPLRYRKITKSYTIVNTLNPQKFFDFESMKNFLKGDGLGKFSKSTTRSRSLGGYLVGGRKYLERCLRGR